MSALGDVIVDSLQDLLRVLFTPIRSVIETQGDAIVKTVVGTPAPNAVFERPTNGPWPGLYDYHWETIVPLALFIWGLSIGLVILLESMSHLFSGYHRSKLKRRAFTGLLGILSWWWIAALSLRFTDALAGFLVPTLSDIGLFEALSFAAMGVLGLVLTLSVDLILFVLIAVIYFARQMALYLFVLMMPILIALWIPGVGPLSLVSGLMKRIARFYVPFLFMTVPVALLFRVGAVLGDQVELSAGGLGVWLSALIIPILALVLPFVLFWQAGTLFSMTDKMSRRASTRQMRQRTGRIHDAGTRAEHTTRNFARGVRGHGAMDADGTRSFESGDSRANRRGLQVRSQAENAVTGLRGRVGSIRERADQSNSREQTMSDSSTGDTSTESESEQESTTTTRSSSSGLTPTGGLSSTRTGTTTRSDGTTEGTDPSPDQPPESTAGHSDSTEDTDGESSETRQNLTDAPSEPTADGDTEDERSDVSQDRTDDTTETVHSETTPSRSIEERPTETSESETDDGDDSFGSPVDHEQDDGEDGEADENSNREL